MKRGPKADTAATKRSRGTFKPYRDDGRVQVMLPDALPVQPTWLTEAGQLEWLDNIGRVASTRLATETDSVLFGTLCNLAGALAQCWQSGAVPPAAHLVELRRLGELFGIAGPRSRVDAPKRPTEANPFTTRRYPEGDAS